MAKMNWSKVQRHCKDDAYCRKVDYETRFLDDNIATSDKPSKKKKTNKGALNTQAMKLASQLYHRMLNEPDFKDDDKQQLWQMAVAFAKARLGITK